VADDRKQELARLLKRGLNHYGLGDLGAAIQCWEAVLEIDPANRAAHDYLETAYEESGSAPEPSAPAAPPAAPEPESAPSPRIGEAQPAFDDEDTPRTFDGAASLKLPAAGDEPDDAVARALRAYKEGKMDEAWDLLQEVIGREPDRLDLQGYVAMMRAERARSWAREVGDQGRVLCLKQTMAELMQLNLTPNEGFLLSQIDGLVSIEQLLNLAKDRVQTLQILAKFLRDGLVE
jgi:tetratricopeptide (TPR) repeat protein